MIVILNGPLGVGKTETAWKLLEYFERAAILDCDYVGGNVSSFDYHNPASVRAATGSLVALAEHQKSASGVGDFVVSGVFENPEQLSFARSVLSQVSEPVVTYLLLAESGILERRVRNRMNGDVEREVARALELSGILTSAKGDLGKPFDTSQLELDTVAEMLWRDIQLLT